MAAGRKRLLDLFAKAGGGAVGYDRAGFEVIGVDKDEQPNYPFTLHQADVSKASFWATFNEGPFAAIHASPPCQYYSTQTADRTKHPDLIHDVRCFLQMTGLPYIIENVEGARHDLIDPIRLCGSSFGLDLRRHRYFETNWPCVGIACNHGWQTKRFQSLDASMVKAGRLATVVGVHGHLNYSGEGEIRAAAMGIDWMTNDELSEAIPPDFTYFVGRQLAGYLRAREAVTP